MFDNYKDTQKIAYNILSNSIKNNKISHAYLIESKGNEKSYDFALSFAKALLCPKKLTNNKNCIGCNQCQIIDDNNFLELEVIDTDDMWLKKEKIENLQSDFNFKPIIGKNKIYIIKNAEKLKENLSNKLLKFIEEPAPGIIAILLIDNKSKILDTILSRCQLISLNNEEKHTIIDDDLTKIVIKFIEYVEQDKLETILYTNSLLHDHMNDRNNYIEVLNVILDFYKSVLNYKINIQKYYISNDYIVEIKKIGEKISFNNILRKIDIIINLKKAILNNANINLIIDKLIIDFAGVNKNESN